MPLASALPLTKDLAVAYLAAAPDAFIVTNSAGEIVMLNRQAEVLFGYERDELLGQSIDVLVPTGHTHGHGKLRAIYNADPTTRTMGDEQSRVHAQHKHGDNIPVEVALSPISFEGSTGVIAIVRDTTDRKATEDRLRASELAFRTAFNEAPVAMAISSTEDSDAGRILDANQALVDLLGWDENELGQRQLQDLVQSEREEEPALPDGVSDSQADQHFHHRDGHLIWGDVHTSQIGALDGEVRRLSHIVDVTRRVEAEQQRDRREGLLTALAEIRKMTLYETSIDEVLNMVLGTICSLTNTDHAFIAIPDHERGLTYRAMRSNLSADQSGDELRNAVPVLDLVRRGDVVCLSAQAAAVALPELPEIGPCVVIPLVSANRTEGVLVAGRAAGSEDFDHEAVDTATSLAAEAALTFELANARADRRRIFLVEDRERIARDLHDVVIQRLFAAGMSLNASLQAPERLQQRATTVIDELDATIDVIRETIFKLTQPDVSLAGEVGRIVDRYRTLGRNDVELEVHGDLTTVSKNVATHLLPTLNELLSNVDRHANAHGASVRIEVGDDVILQVRDDGEGIDHSKPHGFGVRNIANRAEHLGGSVHTTSNRDPGGTTVIWAVPNPSDGTSESGSAEG